MAPATKTRSSKRVTSSRNAKPRGVRVNPDWTIRRARGLQIVQSPKLSKLGWLAHGFSTRPGGESLLEGKRVLNLGFTDWDAREHVAANRAKFTAAIPAGENDSRDAAAISLRCRFMLRTRPLRKRRKRTLWQRARAGLLLGVQTADCVPILLADVRNRAVAAIHAGWRGTLARVAVKTLGRMQMEFGARPRDVIAALGPAIGRCCYEVGSEVARSFAAQIPNAAEVVRRAIRSTSLWRRSRCGFRG